MISARRKGIAAIVRRDKMDELQGSGRDRLQRTVPQSMHRGRHRAKDAGAGTYGVLACCAGL